jgi:hypothetical protein
MGFNLAFKALIKRKVNCTFLPYFNSNVYLKSHHCSAVSRGPLWTQNVNIYSFIHSDGNTKFSAHQNYINPKVHALFTSNEVCRTQILGTKQTNKRTTTNVSLKNLDAAKPESKDSCRLYRLKFYSNRIFTTRQI